MVFEKYGCIDLGVFWVLEARVCGAGGEVVWWPLDCRSGMDIPRRFSAEELGLDSGRRERAVLDRGGWGGVWDSDAVCVRELLR